MSDVQPPMGLLHATELLFPYAFDDISLSSPVADIDPSFLFEHSPADITELLHSAEPGFARPPPTDNAGLSPLSKYAVNDMQKMRILREYVKENGCCPKNDTIYRGVRIGNWQKHQRKKYFRKQLTQDQIQELESLPGWKWSRNQVDNLGNRLNCSLNWKNAAKFARRRQIVYEFVQKNGCYPKRNTVCEGIRIGNWQTYQRLRYHQNKLTQYQIQEMESLPGWKWSGDYMKGAQFPPRWVSNASAAGR